jgi:cellulose synthase operon protein YhjQ
VVDTPPGPSLYQQQALRASNFTLVVIHADAASYATITSMENILQRYCAGRDGFAGSAYLLNSVSSASALSRDVVRVVRSDLGDRVIPVVIHQDESVREAMAFDQPVLVYAPHGEATRDIRHVISWFDKSLPAILSVANAKSA